MLQRPATAESTIFDKTRWLSSEMLILNQKFIEATCALETARFDSDLQGMRNAKSKIDTILDQSAQLMWSLKSAFDRNGQ